MFHRNVTGYCLFPFHSDKQSISRLSKKLFPGQSSWFMQAYDHATSVTPNGFLYVDTSNVTHFKEKFRIRNFLAPVYPQEDAEQSDEEPASPQEPPIRAAAKKNNQYLYADLNTESPTY